MACCSCPDILFRYLRKLKQLSLTENQLTKLPETIGHSVNGDYHLHIARALCYKTLGKKELAIDIIEGQLQDSTYFIGIYDFMYLGVLYQETEQYEQAIAAFARQEP